MPEDLNQRISIDAEEENDEVFSPESRRVYS